MPTETQVELDIFNLLGQRIVRLVDGKLNAGEHMVSWAGQNEHGQSVASGPYFYRLRTDTGFLQIRKMLRLR